MLQTNVCSSAFTTCCVLKSVYTNSFYYGSEVSDKWNTKHLRNCVSFCFLASHWGRRIKIASSSSSSSSPFHDAIYWEQEQLGQVMCIILQAVWMGQHHRIGRATNGGWGELVRWRINTVRWWSSGSFWICGNGCTEMLLAGCLLQSLSCLIPLPCWSSIIHHWKPGV